MAFNNYFSQNDREVPLNLTTIFIFVNQKGYRTYGGFLRLLFETMVRHLMMVKIRLIIYLFHFAFGPFVQRIRRPFTERLSGTTKKFPGPDEHRNGPFQMADRKYVFKIYSKFSSNMKFVNENRNFIQNPNFHQKSKLN